MRPLRRKGVPLPEFGIRKKRLTKKLIPRKSKPLQIMRPAKEKPDADKVFIKPSLTKEEKHSPKETKSFENVSINKLRDMVADLSDQELKDIAASDSRVTAKRLASEELIDRKTEREG